MTNGIMDCIGCTTHWWLLCMLYIINLLNVITNSMSFIPYTVMHGEVTDASPYLDNHFWQDMFVEDPKSGE